MKTPNPVDLLFADMEKLSPGDDSLSLYVLRSLPEHRFELVVDAGCGAGRQTMVLASELGTLIQAVDSYQPFLNRLKWRAKEKGLAHLVQVHCMTTSSAGHSLVRRPFEKITLPIGSRTTHQRA